MSRCPMTSASPEEDQEDNATISHHSQRHRTSRVTYTLPSQLTMLSIILLMGLSTGSCTSCWWTSQAPGSWCTNAGPESSPPHPALLNSQLQKYYIPFIEPLTWNWVRGWKLLWGATQHTHLLCYLSPT